jgi:hypothetical protein
LSELRTGREGGDGLSWTGAAAAVVSVIVGPMVSALRTPRMGRSTLWGGPGVTPRRSEGPEGNTLSTTELVVVLWAENS